MTRHLPQSVRRAAALVTSLLLVAAQLALPAAALATDVDTALLPVVTLYYQLTAEETPSPSPIFASVYGGQPIYWAQLPEQAFANPITVEVMGSVEDPSYTYGPASGTQLPALNAAVVDGSSFAANIEIYQNGALAAAYPLYLSSIPLPAEEAQAFPVQVKYMGTDGVSLLDDVQMLAPGVYPLTPGRAAEAEAKGYTLQEPSTVEVTVNADGTYSPMPVTFYFSPPQRSATVEIAYMGPDGMLLSDVRENVEPGTHTFSADRRAEAEAMGYVLQGADSVEVTVYDDGTYSPSPVTFTFQKEQREEQKVRVEIHYISAEDGSTLLSDVREFVPGGPYSLTADRAGELSEYALQGAATAEVTVYDDGTYSPSPVTFTFQRTGQTDPSQPETGEGEGGGEEGGEAVPPAESAVNRYGITNKGGLNFRKETNTNSNSNRVFTGVSKGEYAWVYASLTVDGQEWLRIRYKDTDCFVVAEYVDVLSQEDSDKYEAAGAEPVKVEVRYVDEATGEAFYQEFAVCAVYNQTTVSVKPEMAQGYTLVSDSSVVVTVDRDGNADPASVTFGFTRDQRSADVYMSYADEDGEFAGETVTFPEGEHDVSPNANLVPNGYTLVNASAQSVRVEADGTATPSSVTFTYQKPAVTGTVTFRYLDGDGNPIAEDRVETLGKGGHAASDYQMAAPEGYAYQGASAETVTIDDGGNADPQTVVFTYLKNPVTGVITLRYLSTEGGQVADERTETLGEGTYSASSFAITPPEGYAYQGVSAESFVIDSNGVATPDTLTFTYAPVETPSKPAELTVSYIDQETGAPVAEPSVRTLEPGSYGAGEFAIAVPEGYEYLGASAEQVVVSKDGVATPDTLTFTYVKVEAPAVKAEVTFTFVSSAGQALVDPMTVELEAGEHPTAEYAAVVEGYTLQGASADTVTVDQKGVANPASVVFTYTENKTSARLEVRYTNAFGEEFPNSPQVMELGAGTYNITPDASYVPAGYSLRPGSASSYQVTVGANLVATPNQITFSYYDASVTGLVKINYIDASTGQTIVSEDRKLPPGTTVVTPDASLVPSSYKRSDADTESVPVTVSETGVTTPTQVAFYYQPVNIDMYIGYAVATTQTALRSNPNSADSYIKQTLPAGTLLYVNGQHTSGSVVWDSVQLPLGGSASGFVLDSATRHISGAEAQKIIDDYNQNNPSHPEQSSGFYITIGSNVPLRAVADPYASVYRYLAIDTVVYVSGQTYAANDAVGWHVSVYDGFTGYIRTDQLRKMTTSEVEAYMSSIKTTAPTHTNTPAPYDPYAKSSYGYVTSSTVNFRATPNGTKLKTLNKYAFGLILGTKEVNGVTWYNVNQSGVIGWIHGSYFHQLNLTELSSFLNSNEYLQGLQNSSKPGSGSSSGGSGSSSGGSTSGGSSGSATQGNISSVEDWNVGTWQNTGVTTQTSYAPFNPYATPGATASVSPSASVAPTSTFVIGTMIPINYEDESKETQTGSVPWGLIGAGVVLIGGAGGVYAYALNQNKKRKAAAARAAASRRAGVNGAGATGGQQAQSPYARRAVAAPPVSGTTRQNDDKQNPGATPGGAGGATFGGVKNPYSAGSITGAGANAASPYGRPQGSTGSPGYPSPYGTGATGTTPPAYGAGSAEIKSAPYGTGSGTGTAGTPGGAPVGKTTSPQMTPPAINPGASTGSNPYARPLGTQTPSAPTAEDASAPRRATRMQRYHAAEDGEDNGDKA